MWPAGWLCVCSCADISGRVFIKVKLRVPAAALLWIWTIAVIGSLPASLRVSADTAWGGTLIEHRRFRVCRQGFSGGDASLTAADTFHYYFISEVFPEKTGVRYSVLFLISTTNLMCGINPAVLCWTFVSLTALKLDSIETPILNTE